MAARNSAHFGRTKDALIEDTVRAALVIARPALDEILSVWPPGTHDRVVLWAKLGVDGSIATGAHLRARVIEGASIPLARQVRRVRNDVPVVLEHVEVGCVVVPMRALAARR